MRRARIVIVLGLALLPLGAFAACSEPSGADGSGGGHGGGGGAGGLGGGSGGGSGGGGAHFGVGFPLDRDAGVPRQGFDGTSDLDVAGRLACFDGVDADGDGALDCDDLACRSLRACCVGHGECIARAGASAAEADLLGCSGTDVAPCFAAFGEARAFGNPLPYVMDGVFHPGGDGEYESGVVIGEPLEARSRRIEARFVLEAPSECGPSCIESVGLSFVAEPPVGDEAVVTIDVGLLASGARGTVALVLGDAITAAWPAADGDVWDLVLRPDGVVEVSQNGAPVPGGARAFEVPSELSLVLHGHQRAAPGAHTGLATVALETFLVEAPRGFRDRESLVVMGDATWPSPAPDGGAEWPDLDAGLFDDAGTFDAGTFDAGTFDDAGLPPSLPSFDAVDVVRAGRGEAGETLLAVELAGRILLLVTSGGAEAAFLGELAWSLGPDVSVRDLEPFEDPSTHTWLAAFTYVADGRRSVAVGRLALSAAPRLEDVRMIVPGSETERFDQPTVSAYPGGGFLVIHRAFRLEGRPTLLAGYLPCGACADTLEHPAEGALDEATLALGADDLAHPSLIARAGAHELYVSVRRGARWSVRTLASHELLAWRVLEPPALAAMGTGRERLGVRSASVVEAGGLVHAYYLGLDGVRSTLRHASREAPVDPRF